jgi:hypothetical protein
MDVALTAAVDREAASIRNLLDEQPVFAEMFREGSNPWSDGARLVVIDCLAVLQHRGTDAAVARLWAWDRTTS